jgi:O-antigen ligase
MNRLILTLFFVALFVAGMLGTETRLLFFWPACVLLGIAGAANVLRRKVRVSFQPSDLCLVTVLLAGAYLAGRAAMSPVVELAREDLVMICAGLIAYLITVTSASHPRWRLLMVMVLVLLALGNLGVGAVHFSGNWTFHVLPQFARAFEPGRIGGFYNNPNHLAAFFSLVVFMTCAVLCFGRAAVVWKLLLAFVCISSMLGMALTISRGALGGLLVGGLAFAILSLWILRHTYPHLVGRIILGVLLLGVTLGGVLWKVNEDYLRRRMASQDAAGDLRWSIWHSAAVQNAQQPWIGEGARMFQDGCARYRQPDMPVWIGDAEFAHNEWMQLLADYGWIGFVLLALALGVHLLNGLRFFAWFVRERFPLSGTLASNNLALALGSICALTATAVHALVEFQWHVGSIVVFGAVMLGILANPGFEVPEKPARRLPGVRPLIKLSATAAAALLLWLSATVGRGDFHGARSEVLNLRGDRAGAITELEKSLALDPASGSRWFLLGQLRLDQVAETVVPEEREKWIDLAAADLEKAAELNPFRWYYATALADVHFAKGDKTRALSEVRRALYLAPLHEEPRLALAVFHHRQGDFFAAERAYLWAGAAGSGNAGDALTSGEAYNQLLKDADTLAELGGVPR